MLFKRCGKRGVRFENTGQRSKGITKVIQQVFFPAYKVRDLRGSPIKNKGGLRLRQAKLRGKLIDRQLAKMVGDKLSLKLPPRACEETKQIIAFIHK